jgi:peptidyl-prolyl cis-trans isomerase D
MFDFLRKMLLPIMVILIIAFIGWLVLDVGLDLTGRRGMKDRNSYAGIINGEKIPWNTFNQILNNLQDNETQKSDQDLPDSKVKELEQNAWQQIVHEKLLEQQAKINNISVTDEEVYAYLRMAPPQYLQQAPAFMTNGRFDYQKYVQAMADPQASSFWASIEPSIRSEYQRIKMQELIIQTVQVSELEVRQAFLDANEKVKIGIVNVPFNKYSTQVPTPSEDEAKQYYNQNQNKFKADERAVLNVIMIDNKATEADWERVRIQMLTILDSIKAGSDFATMAMAYSEDPASRANGGDYGWIDQGRMVSDFDQRCFGMNEGEISDPFRTEFGWHILKHYGYREVPVDSTDKNSKATKKQAHIAHILLKVTPSQETTDASWRKLQDLVSEAKQSNNLNAAAANAGLTVLKTAPFSKSNYIQYLGSDPGMSAFAFENPVGTFSEVSENSTAVYVAQIAERMPAGIESFEEARSQVIQDIRNTSLAAVCHDNAMVVYNSARATGNLESAAKQHNFEYTTSSLISRTSYLPGVGSAPEIEGAAFALTSLGQISNPINWNQGCAIVVLLERQPANQDIFNQKRDSVFNAVKQTKQQDLYSRWIMNLFNTSKIESYIGRTSSSSNK